MTRSLKQFPSDLQYAVTIHRLNPFEDVTGECVPPVSVMLVTSIHTIQGSGKEELMPSALKGTLLPVPVEHESQKDSLRAVLFNFVVLLCHLGSYCSSTSPNSLKSNMNSNLNDTEASATSGGRSGNAKQVRNDSEG